MLEQFFAFLNEALIERELDFSGISEAEQLSSNLISILINQMEFLFRTQHVLISLLRTEIDYQQTSHTN